MNYIKKIIYNLLRVATLESDSKALHLKKISIMMVPLIMGPVGFFWSLIYYNLGYTIPATISLSYTIASVFMIIHFKITKDISFILKGQMTFILLSPFVLMWSLGGFYQSSYIFIWAVFAPIIALIHDKSEKSFYWLYAFILLVIITAIGDTWLMETINLKLSPVTRQVFFILNISIALSGIYFLIRYFIFENDKNSDAILLKEHEALLKSTKALEDNISFLQSYKNNIDNNLIVTKTDLKGNITFANRNFYKLTGFTQDEVIGKSHSIIKHPDTALHVFKDLWQTVLSKKTWSGILKNRKKDGASYWIDTTISPILDKDNTIVEIIAIRHNITELMQHQDELTYLLYTDTLTNLKNRNSILQLLKTDTKFSSILINIDNFSHINSLYGETFGNKVLIEFSKFLISLTKDDNKLRLFRLSGDEFVILSTYKHFEKIVQCAHTVIEKNQNNTIFIEEQSISLRITLGISNKSNNQLLTSSNMALVRARQEASNMKIYTDELSLNDEYENNLKWIKEIKDAIDDDRITMFFQPIVDHADPSQKKYESLIRLIDKQGNVIAPYYFLEIAKKAKLYKQLTKIVIRKSFEAFKDNQYEFSINITIDDILDLDINSYIIEILNEYNISDRVIFEIVESESIENFDEIEKFIINIKKFGCRISIDDFGTGYSNFEHLMRLQADYIKIDGSIIKEITTDKRSALITSIIVAFAKEMKIETIGEFVETKEINDKLIALGVNKSQGYYHDKPKATLD